MSPSHPRSLSLIQRASHVLHIRVERTHAEPWQAGAGGWNERSVQVEAVVDELLKGHIDARPGTRMAAVVVQRQNPSPMSMPVPGIWSSIALDAGADLVVFAATEQASPAPQRLLAEPPAIAVLESASELPGIRLALRHAAGDLHAAAFLHAAAGILLGSSLVDYLAAVLPDPAFATPDAFHALLVLLETARAPVPVRAALIDAVINGVPQNPAFGDRQFNRMVATLLRVGILGQAGPLEENLLTVDIPALVGLRGGEPRPASVVFEGDAAARTALLQALRSRPDRPGAALLVPWLAAP